MKCLNYKMSFPPTPPMPWMQMRFGLIPHFTHNFDKTIDQPNPFLLPFWKKDEQSFKNKWQDKNLK